MNNKQVLRDKEGNFIAFCLGSDFCAEHEWGIQGIQKSFGISNDTNIAGIERRRISQNQNVFLIEGKKYSVLLGMDEWKVDFYKNAFDDLDKEVNKGEGIFSHYCLYPKLVCNKNGRLKISADWEFSSAWSEEDFGIIVNKEKLGDEIKQLYEAFKQNDIAIWFGERSNPFDNAGLIIGIVSAIPKEYKDQMRKADEDAFKLKMAADATGIVQKIDEINQQDPEMYPKKFGYYALSPRWADSVDTVIRPVGHPDKWEHDEVAIDTKYDVIFWLNPKDQQKCESGWYTVEELQQWIEGKGPVVENSKEARRKTFGKDKNERIIKERHI